jgi:hypothetical protein
MADRSPSENSDGLSSQDETNSSASTGGASGNGGNTDEFGRPTAVASSGSDGGGSGGGGPGSGGPGSGGPGDTGPGICGGADTGPFSIGLGSGATDGRLVGADVGNGGDLAHVGAIVRGHPLDLNGLSGGNSGDHAVTAGIGASGGPLLADAGLLTGADGRSPLSAQIAGVPTSPMPACSATTRRWRRRPLSCRASGLRASTAARAIIR